MVQYYPLCASYTNGDRPLMVLWKTANEEDDRRICFLLGVLIVRSSVII